MSDTKIPLAAIIGSPVNHSKSPRIHNFWLQKYDLPGYYIPMDIAPDKLVDTIRRLPDMGFAGVNVTIPHKEQAIKAADVVSDRAAVMGAANFITFARDGKILADNTDGQGFLDNLRHGAPDWQANTGPVAVIGAGGAARAVIAALLEAGTTEIRLTNRTRARAEALRTEFGTKINVYDWVHAGAALDGAATVVNTSSLGMTGKADFRVPLDALSPEAVVTDLVYTPIETTLLKHAKSIGCTTVDGLGMLLYQAVPAFERWFGKRPVLDDEIRALVQAP